MELCTSRALLNLSPNIHRPRHHSQRYRAATPTPGYKTSLSFNQALISCSTRRALFHRVGYWTKSLPRATKSEETTTETNKLVEEEDDGMVTVEDVPSEKNGYNESFLDGRRNSDSLSDEQNQINEFLEKLNIKLDSEDTYPILLYGSGALIALWLAAAVVGAIESIPLFPKLLEVVGLGYTVWFSSRYLLFKKNRDELAAKIEELKQQILGLGDD